MGRPLLSFMGGMALRNIRRSGQRDSARIRAGRSGSEPTAATNLTIPQAHREPADRFQRLRIPGIKGGICVCLRGRMDACGGP
jgi:hypothetical protein